MIDDGHAVHYTAVERGVPVYSSDEIEVGHVEEIVDNYREHIFDGIVMRTPEGDMRFVDAPEVKRTAERAVTLTITAAEAEQLPPPEQGGFAEFEPRKGAGKVARKLGMGWRKKKR
jgi:hypothetical protein